nr:hypothetical protein CFP56_26741 [Quercus suber]
MLPCQGVPSPLMWPGGLDERIQCRGDSSPKACSFTVLPSPTRSTGPPLPRIFKESPLVGCCSCSSEVSDARGQGHPRICSSGVDPRAFILGPFMHPRRGPLGLAWSGPRLPDFLAPQ